jgi:beta-phosphoglucomutase-like phosphatase (HAD superfamily)
MQNLFLDLLDEALPALESTVDLLRELQDAGIATAIYSPSHNCQRVLRAADIENLFAVRVDAVIAGGSRLRASPNPPPSPK